MSCALECSNKWFRGALSWSISHWGSLGTVKARGSSVTKPLCQRTERTRQILALSVREDPSRFEASFGIDFSACTSIDLELHTASWKLKVFFPVPFRPPRLYEDCCGCKRVEDGTKRVKSAVWIKFLPVSFFHSCSTLYPQSAQSTVKGSMPCSTGLCHWF